MTARTATATAPDPSIGTTLVATSACPAGEVLVGGGARVGVKGPTGTGSSSGDAGAGTASGSSSTPQGAGTTRSAGSTGSAGGPSGAATAPGAGAVALESSYPVSGGAWRTVAVVVGQLGTGESMTLHPYVLCGKP
jgi:hypothetical protein